MVKKTETVTLTQDQLQDTIAKAVQAALAAQPKKANGKAEAPKPFIRLEDKERENGVGVFLHFGGKMDRFLYLHEIVEMLEKLDIVKAFVKTNAAKLK